MTTRTLTAPSMTSTRRKGWMSMLVNLERAYRHRVSLQEVSDMLLKDVGLTRAQLEREAQAPSWNSPSWMRQPW